MSKMKGSTGKRGSELMAVVAQRWRDSSEADKAVSVRSMYTILLPWGYWSVVA